MSIRNVLVLGAALLLVAGRMSLAGERVVPLDMLKHAPSEKPLHLKALEDGTLEWYLPPGKGEALVLDLAALGVDPAGYDEIRFDLKPVNGEVEVSMKLVGHLPDGQVGKWYLKCKTPVGEWTEVRYELALDDDGLTRKPEVDKKELTVQCGIRRLGRPGEPEDRTALLRNLRLVRRLVRADFLLMESTVEETEAEIANIYPLHVTNKTDKACVAAIELDGAKTLKYFRASGPASVDLAAGETKVVPVRLFMDKALAMSMAPLYSEPLYP